MLLCLSCLCWKVALLLVSLWSDFKHFLPHSCPVGLQSGHLFSFPKLFLDPRRQLDPLPWAATRSALMSCPPQHVLIYEYQSVLGQACGSHVTLVWQSCESHVTVMWESCDCHVQYVSHWTVMWESCDKCMTGTLLWGDACCLLFLFAVMRCCHHTFQKYLLIAQITSTIIRQ